MRETKKIELLGRKLKKLRKERKLSTAEVAGRTGIDAQDLVRIERGEARVSIEALIRLLTEFQLDPAALAALPEPDTQPRERFRRDLSRRSRRLP